MATIAVPSNEIQVPEKQLLRMHQREEYAAEIDGMKDMLPNLKSGQDRGAVAQRVKRLEKSVQEQSPLEQLPGSAKDRLYKEGQALEAKIKCGMLSSEEMRKNPAGSVGQHMRWEKAVKKDILKWKNIQIMLEPTSNDPDLANFERLRPEGARNRVRVDAQIPGKMSFTDIPQEKWDTAFEGKEPENTALEQAKKRNVYWPPEKRADQARRINEARARKKLEEAQAPVDPAMLLDAAVEQEEADHGGE